MKKYILILGFVLISAFFSNQAYAQCVAGSGYDYITTQTSSTYDCSYTCPGPTCCGYYDSGDGNFHFNDGRVTPPCTPFGRYVPNTCGSNSYSTSYYCPGTSCSKFCSDPASCATTCAPTSCTYVSGVTAWSACTNGVQYATGVTYATTTPGDPTCVDVSITKQCDQACRINDYPTDGLIGMWTFDTADGSTDTILKDTVGNNNGSPIKVEQITSPIKGEAYHFPSIPAGCDPCSKADVSIVDIANEQNFDFNANDNITISSFFKLDNVSDPNMVIVSKSSHQYNAVTSVATNYQISASKNQIVFLQTHYQFGDYVTFSEVYYAPISIAAESWHHVVVTYTFGVANTMKVYLDGNLISGSWSPATYYTNPQGGYTLVTGGNGNTAYFVNDGLLKFGWHPDGGTKGSLDEIGIWRKELTSTEILKLYNSYFPANQSECITSCYSSTDKPVSLINLINVNPNLSTNLISNWPLDGNTNDVIGGHNGTALGSPIWSGGMAGLSWETNGYGTANTINVPHSPVYDFGTGDFTLSSWAYFNNLTEQQFLPFEKAVPGTGSWEESFALGFSGCQYKMSNQNQINFGYWYAGSGVSTWTAQSTENWCPTTNTWHHMLVKRESGVLSFYVDGLKFGNPIPLNVSLYAGTSPLTLGGGTNGGSMVSTLNGRMDDLAIWNRSLTDCEIKQIALGPNACNDVCSTCYSPEDLKMPLSKSLGLTSPNLISYWPLDGNANDLKGTSHGTVIGATLSSGMDNFNSAYAFNGSTNYINLDNPSTLSFSGAGTFSAWVKMNGTGNNCQTLVSISDKHGPLHNDWDVYLGDNCANSLNPYTLITVVKQVNGTDVGNDSVYELAYKSANKPEIFDGKWHLITIISDGTKIHIYLDGVEKPVDVGVGSNNGGWTDSTGVDSATIGTEFYRGLGPMVFFDGVVDDAAIWGRALTECEIKKLFLGPNACNEVCDTLTASCTATSGNNFIAPANITLTASSTGGTGPFKYDWSGTLINLSNSSLSEVTVPNVVAGVYNNKVKIIDTSDNASTTANCQKTLSNLIEIIPGITGGACGDEFNKTIPSSYPALTSLYPGLCAVNNTVSNFIFVSDPTNPKWTWDCVGNNSPVTTKSCSAFKATAALGIDCVVSMDPYSSKVNVNADTSWTVSAKDGITSLTGKEKAWKLTDINNPTGKDLATTTSNTFNNIFTTIGLKTMSVSVSGGTPCTATTTVVQQGGSSGEI